MNLRNYPQALPAEVLAAMTDVLEGYVKLPLTAENDNQNRFGGYITVVEFDPNYPEDVMRHRLIVVARCGMPAPDKALKYRQFAEEKARRLLEHLPSGHLTSRESADPEVEQYPGAIVAGNFVISFSGLPADFDEAVCVMIGVLLGLLTKDQLMSILDRTQNPHISAFGDHFPEYFRLLVE